MLKVNKIREFFYFYIFITKDLFLLFKEFLYAILFNIGAIITTIYLIRHAKSLANKTGMFGGTTDFSLCEEGLLEAENLSKKFQKKNIKIDAIYSSPLKRAIQTISPTSSRLKLPINIEEDLREIYVGEWENKLRADLVKKFPKENEYIYSTEHYINMKNQEETSDVAERMLKVITRISKNNPNKNIAITSHLVAIRAFLCLIQNIPFEKTKEMIGEISNTGITTLKYDDENQKFTIISLND